MSRKSFCYIRLIINVLAGPSSIVLNKIGLRRKIMFFVGRKKQSAILIANKLLNYK